MGEGTTGSSMVSPSHAMVSPALDEGSVTGVSDADCLPEHLEAEQPNTKTATESATTGNLISAMHKNIPDTAIRHRCVSVPCVFSAPSLTTSPPEEAVEITSEGGYEKPSPKGG